MNYFASLIILPWTLLVSSQTTTISNAQRNSFGNTGFTVAADNTSVASITTAVFVPREIVDRSLPVPSGLTKRSANTTALFLRFSLPENFLNNKNYSHFRIDYENNFEKQNIELPKTVDLDQIILPRLQSGILYKISARTQGKDTLGNYLLSDATEPIKARTIPLPVSNLRVIPQENSLKEVLVAWDRPPTPLKGPKYDYFILSYTILNESKNMSVDNTKSKHIEHKPGNAAKNVSQRVQIAPGAKYRFSVVTKSTGEDPTESSPLEITRQFLLPRPVSIKKSAYNETSISIEWEIHKDLTNISQHVVTYQRFKNDTQGSARVKSITVPAGIKRCDITGLTPGALYQVFIKSLRADMPFGKESERKMIKVRTSPLPPNVTVSNVGMSDVTFTVGTMGSGEATSIYAEYEMLHSNATHPKRKYELGRKKLTIDGLVPGQLYRITLSLSSRESLPVDETSTSATELIRTIPRPPQSFTGSGKQGKILLQWLKPDELVAPTVWRYDIVYYPADSPDKIVSVPLWNRNGVSIFKYSLDRLIPGTLYEIFIYCEVGLDVANNRVARSARAGPLKLYTQPDIPVITTWTQVTLSQVQIQWSPPAQSFARFDYYLLNLTRLLLTESAIEFRSESLSYKIDKQETEKVLKLSFGSKYRAILTTVVGEGNVWMQSVQTSSNSKVFETWSPYDSHQLFSRCVWMFETCTKNGRFGPTQNECNSVYNSTTLKHLVSVKDGIQRWMVPIEGLYRITAAGAGYQGPGGLGATVSGLFHLVEGSTLLIAVGQQGDYGGAMTNGGAGGSFVISADDENEPLVVAGGAGTAHVLLPPSPLANGRLNHTAGDASETGQGFGKGGSAQNLGPGLPGTSNTAGGAGYRGTSKSAVSFGDRVFAAAGFLPFYGDQTDVNKTEESRVIPLMGGRYERENGDHSVGGFGGGGSSYGMGAGGGGGYTGGGGGPANGYSGGGGSYIKFTGGTQYADVTNSDVGYVEITLVGLPVSSPIPVTLYLVVSFLVGIGLTLCFGALLLWVDKCAGRRLSDRTAPNDTSLSSDTTTSPDYYETSVHVTDTSPSMSGLYVRDVAEPDEVSYRKYSEVDSYDEMPHSSAQVSIPPRILENEESDYEHEQREISIQKRKRAGFNNDAYSASEEEPQSESTPSAISSYRSDIDKITNDVYAWDLQEEESQSSSGEDRQSERFSLPPPPTPPPLDGRAGEQQKERFRRSLKNAS